MVKITLCLFSEYNFIIIAQDHLSRNGDGNLKMGALEEGGEGLVGIR